MGAKRSARVITIFLAVMATLLATQAGCGRRAAASEPTGIKLSFSIYNHTQGLKATFAKINVTAGSKVTLNVQQLLASYSITGVDTRRIVLRLEGFGQLVEFSNTGELGFTAPGKDTGYDIYLFNALGKNSEGDQASYGWMDDQHAHLYAGTNTPVVYRKDFDGQTGSERAWGGELLAETGSTGVFDQLNAALQMPGVTFRYGFIDRQPAATNGTFSYGYGHSDGFVGSDDGERITVNAENNETIISRVAVGLMVAFDNITSTRSIGNNPSWATIQDPGVLNQNGKDLFAYVFVKDSNARALTAGGYGPHAPSPRSSLSGIVFFDLNGDGRRDIQEPPISGASLEVGGRSVLTGSDGRYSLDGLASGAIQVRLKTAGFRFLSLPDGSFQSTENAIAVLVDGQTQRDWGMMQGFLTLPYAPDSIVRVMTYEDLDENRGKVRDWQGTTTVRTDMKGGPGSVYDGHQGIDYGYGENGDLCDMKVFAAAPGWVETSRPAGGKGGVIRLVHPEGFVTEYGHLMNSVVSEGQEVGRGALLGTTSCGWAIPHLHLALYDGEKRWLPIYRDPQDAGAVSYWTKENSPQFAAGYR